MFRRFDRVLLLKGRVSGVLSQRAMDKAGQNLEGRDGSVSLFDGRLGFRVIGHLCKSFARGLAPKYVRDAMMEFGGDNDGSDLTDGESSSDGEVPKVAVLTPTRVTSSLLLVLTSMTTIRCLVTSMRVC